MFILVDFSIVFVATILKFNVTISITIHNCFTNSTIDDVFPLISNAFVLLQLHVDGRPHVCSVCSKAYALPEALKSHIRLKHPQKQVIYKCKKCDKVFRHPSGLSRHQHKHFGTVFLCKVCNKSFNDMATIKKHVSKHDDGGKKGDLKSLISKLLPRKQELIYEEVSIYQIL